MPNKHYVNSQDLEDWWQGWLVTECPFAWSQMSEMIYRICQGIATKFNPKDDDEYQEHIHDAFAQTMEKIRMGKLRFTRGRAPVFNLITTTVFRILYSKMNRGKKQREHNKRFTFEWVQKNVPELIHNFEYPYSKEVAC
jgi:hypothetical protein